MLAIQGFRLMLTSRVPSKALVQGFTLIELLITVTILAIVLALGAPSLSTAIAQQRVRTGAEGVMAGLQLARTEAVNRNTNVSFTLGSNAGWTVAVVAPATTIQTRPASETGGGATVTTANGNTTLTFNSLGEVSNYSATTTLKEIVVSPPTGIRADTLEINISAGGHVRLCNQSIVVAGDPRSC